MAVAVLHPELFHTDMRSRQSNPNFTHPPLQNPNFAGPHSRRRPPHKGIIKKNNRNTAAMESKKLVMGQVKILKRGEELDESMAVLKEVNNRKDSNNAASTSEVSRAPIRSRQVLPKKLLPVSSPKAEGLKPEDVVISSTSRMGPDPEIVSNQMKNITEYFAGSVFSDSPPPSSVPIPGFFRQTGKQDATTDLRRILGLSLR